MELVQRRGNVSNIHRGQPVATLGAPLGAGRGVALLIHGRGRDPDDMLAVAARLAEPAFTYLAPAAAGGSWYPHSFLEPRARNEPALSQALAVYDELVGGLLATGVRREQLVLIGFSQGACLTAEYAFRHPGRYGAVALFTGGLIGPPGTTWAPEGSFEGAPIFIGGSTADPFVPAWRMSESAAVFRQMGAAVSEGLYAGADHIVSDAEVAATRALMGAIGAGA